jgi:hypothetical protein
LWAVTAGETALVVSPTHREGTRITREIRAGLKVAGKLGANERHFGVLENRNLTEAERGERANYARGDVLVFHQNAKGFRRGQRVIVGERPLPLDQRSRFQVFRTAEVPIAPGELIRITRNGMTADGAHALHNGSVYPVKNFTREGDLELANGWIINRGWGFFAPGYVVTSHASQGSTVDRVLIGQSSESFPASSQEQFYVSVSRARKSCVIYCDRKRALLDAVSRRDERITATEFLSRPNMRTRQERYRWREQRDNTAALADHRRGRQGLSHER